MISVHMISRFNPITRPDFKCPVCGGTRFTYLAPFGGLWCDKCNAQIEVMETCDGPSKVCVRVYSKHCHRKEWREAFERAGTVIWEDDETIKWLKYRGSEIIYD